MPRTKVMAANWKMYKTPDQTSEFFRNFLPLVSGHSRDEIVVCPPFLDLPAALEASKESKIAIGAQNVHWKEEGAFTGETSAGQLLALGVSHVIVGPLGTAAIFLRDRRHRESAPESSVGKQGLSPSAAWAKYSKSAKPDSPTTFFVASAYARSNAISAKKAAKLIVAYEPVWAIGTGKTATPELAAEAHAVIRSEATEIFGEEFAGNLRILYGGSVKPENSKPSCRRKKLTGLWWAERRSIQNRLRRS